MTVTDVQNRSKEIVKTSMAGVIANVLLAGFKALTGLISGSIAIILDAVNNLTDAVSSVITIIGIRLAHRKPDNDHPYGHGRIEYFSAILIAGIVLAAGVTSLIESVKKIIHPEMPTFSAVSVAIVAMAVIVKLLLGRYVKKQGVKYRSDALIASGADALLDAVISASTLIGIAVTMIFHITADGWIGVVIAAYIIKAGFGMLTESLSSVIGNRPDSETTKEIKATVRSVEGVHGAYDLILHDYGPDSAIGSVHIEIDSGLTAEEIHRITKRIQLAVQEKYHIFLTVGIYAVDNKHEKERAEIARFAAAHTGVLGTHGVFIDDDLKYISFDVLTDFTADRETLRNEITEHMAGYMPGYRTEVNFDTNFSD